jgi:excisionase family DNA binding protein
MEPLLTIQQVAEYLNVSVKTVRRMRLPCVRLGRLVRYDPRELTRFLAARRHHA